MNIKSLILLVAIVFITGCSNRAHIGDRPGIGAITAQNLGSSRAIAEFGPNVGKGIGYLVADETDREHASSLSDRTRATNYSHKELGALTNTRWDARELSPDGAAPRNLGMTVTFRPSGHVVTRTIMPDSTTRLVTERYRIVGDTLILNGDDYVVNADFRIVGETLTISCGRFRGVFERVRSRDGL